jgi:polysaccharide biosynthesis transport protein
METKGYQEEIDIQKHLLVLKRRWHIIVGVVVASAGLSSVAIFLQKPEYRASGMILVKSDRTSSLTKVGEKIGDLESLMREGNPLNTQAVIVNSQPILQEVINNLNLKDEKGKSLEPDSLKIKVEPIIGTDVLKVSYASKNPKVAAKVVNNVMAAYVKNNIKSNSAQVLAASEFIKRQVPQSREELNRALETLRLFKIQNTIVQLPQESSEAISHIARLDGELNQARAALADVSAQQEQVRGQLNLAGEDAVEVTSLNQIPGVQEVLSELQKVQTKLATERARYTENHPSVTDLKNQEITLSTLLQQRIEQAGGVQQSLPVGKLQIGKLKQDLATELVRLQTQRQGLESKIQTLFNIQERYKEKVVVLPNLEKRQEELQQNLSIAQKNYENLVTRLQEIEVAEKQTVGNAEVIQPARIPSKPILSRVTLLLIGVGVFGGLLSGIAAAFFMDIVDRSLKTVREAETFFGYTLLGLIPKFESNAASIDKVMREGISPRVIVATSPRTMAHEAYQMLQANLKFISHKKLRTIVVTSSVTEEGKSEISANLAAVLAQAGRKVLLIDADMRHPTQHHLWGLLNLVGLSNLIVGQVDFSETVQPITKYLSVLTSGVQPPNPLALIDSERMISLIQTFSEKYDYIIIDTPPLVGIADAAVLGKMTDGVLLVVRPDVADSASAAVAKTLLKRSEANVLGIIANAVNVKHEPDSYFHYSNLRQGIVETKVSQDLQDISITNR